jgi:hypothetical protein
MKGMIKLAPLICKWLLLTIADYLLLVPFFIAAPFASLFTKNGWGVFAFLSTYDNLPQGDSGWIRERSPFPKTIDGFKGYINRVCWLWRNPNYQFQKMAGFNYSKKLKVTLKGNAEISDKYGKAGKYLALATDGTTIKAFEMYAIVPTFKGKCCRVRLGWKINTDKFKKLGFAPLVNTITPHKSFGASLK